MIILKNICNNDEFNYSLIYIQGKIKPFCFCFEIEVLNLTSMDKIKWPITIYGYFKVFCELVDGRNMIKLSCDHNSISICLYYLSKVQKNIVEILLITCSDKDIYSFKTIKDTGNSLENCKARLKLAVKLVQSFMAESLFANGYIKRSFCLDNEIKLFTSKLTIEECLSKTDKDLWHSFAKEITTLYPHKVINTKWVAFMSFTTYEVKENQVPNCHEDVIRFTRGYSALGANGLALLGTGNLYSFPESLNLLTHCFINCQKVDRQKLMDDSAFRGFYWSNFSTSLGAILHELSHCFGMGHSKIGIMHRGGDDINIVLSFTSGSNDCGFCQSKLRKRNLAERRDIEKIDKEKKFLFSRCKSLNHTGQCFWTENNLIMLNNHKWFTQNTPSTLCSNEPFIITNKEVDSLYGFLLIEIRTLYPENLCVGFCNFISQKVYRQTFSARKISGLIKNKSALRTNFNFSLVVMDLIGNIRSVDFVINMNTLSFQFCGKNLKYID